MANSNLCQLKAKQSQFVELSNSITEMIDDMSALEEEICAADVYQFELDNRVAFLTEFLRWANLVPPPVQ